ncbi:MAG: aminomethyl-transferring glycine dehydrogenase subunit GcvPB, partial [Candidatus Bipolaricaulota bacterium]
AHRQFSIDGNVYPLGSCTMKYNPKVHEDAAALFAGLHPSQDPEGAQGVLELLWRLKQGLASVTGMDEVSLQPAAGAHGELTGMLLLKKYFQERDELSARNKVLLPDSSHGTNPASAAMAGFRVVSLKSTTRGTVDLQALEEALDNDVAGIMLTVPNTLGIFEDEITEVSRLVHEVGGLTYFDGANLNAFLGRALPGDMGADIFHFNLHKTFSTPHGGGGPGAGPLAVSEAVAPYLPLPDVVRESEGFSLCWDRPESIGRVHPYHGNFLVSLRALAYILTLGDEGLAEVSTGAVLAANYLRVKLQEVFQLPYNGLCKHEFVLSGQGFGEVRTLDIAKRLMDYGFHPPTVYFPLIVKEALMVEPTETEPREVLDAFAEAMTRIANEAREEPELLQQAPHATPVRRLNEAQAARQPVLRLP